MTSQTKKQPTVLVLRTCAADMTSHGGFKWPKEGIVKAPDWDPEPDCGNGLHGFLWGEGVGELARWDDDAKWLVVEVLKKDVIELGGKVKFPEGKVVCCGDRREATDYLITNGGAGKAVIGAFVIAGDKGTATAGDKGTATAGDKGTATAGDGGTATAGYNGTATAGNYGTATAGDRGAATAGDKGTATAGDGGTATAGYNGTATAGNYGTATAGDRGAATAGNSGTATAGTSGTATAGDRGTATAGTSGTATAGDRGTATAGDGGTATAGDGGTATAGTGGEIRIRWYDGVRYRLAVGYVGEGGIEAGVAYKVEGAGVLVRAKS